MVIDFHTHTFPDKIAGKAIFNLSHTSHTVPFSDGTAAGLVRRMTESGVDCSVVLPVATSPRQVEHINDASARLNAARPQLISLGGMHPDYENWRDELLRIRDLGLKGIKVHPVYQGVDLDDIRFLRIFDRCAELGLLVVTHAGLDIGYPGVVRCSPKMARHVLDEVCGLTLVLAHMGGWRNWDEALELLPETNCYLDTAFSTGRFYPLAEDAYWKEEETSMMGAEEFLQFVRTFGSKRILFGTDSPWSDQGEVLAFLRALPLPADDLENILYKNACRLLGLLENDAALRQ